jgi:protein-tyrosine phosphatase
MSKINNNIWIGNYVNSADETFLKRHSITHILNCAHDFDKLPGNLDKDTYTYFRVPMIEKSFPSHRIEAWLRKGAAKLNQWVKEGHIVLVHCYAGISRSVSVTIAYLILYKGYTFKNAFKLVKEHRPKMHPFNDYVPVLKSLSTKNITRKISRKDK